MLVLLGTFVSRYKLSASSLIPVRALRFKLDPGTHTLIRYTLCASSLIPVKAVRSNAGLGRYVLIPLQAVRFKLDPGTRFALQA